MAGGFKRGGARGGAKKSFTKKRSSPDDDDTPARTSKKAKNDEASDDETVPFVPTLEADEEKNPFVAVSTAPSLTDYKRNVLIGMLR